MADDDSAPKVERDVASDEVWYDRRPFWSRFRAVPIRRIARIVLLIAFLVLLVAFVYFLLKRDQRTPVIVVTTDTYEWPFPPQAWVSEDQALFHDLQDKNVNELSGVSIGASDNSHTLIGFEGLRAEDLASNDDDWALIIYISMHGAAFDGEPYLVPPGASPVDSGRWRSIGDLLKEIDGRLKNVNPGLEHKPKLVVLDCSRVPVNWYLGWLSNDFAGALDDWWKQHEGEFPNFAIMSSAARGERSWTSAELRSSVFAHYFRLGLAGEADTESPWYQVSLAELTNYVEKNVDAWVLANRGDRQHPGVAGELFDPSRGKPNAATNNPRMDWILSTTINSDDREALLSASARSGASQPSVSVAERAKLWEQLDKLRKDQLYRFEPLAWSRLQHVLLSLDQLADAGIAYEQPALDKLKEVQVQRDEIHGRLRQVRDNPSIYAHTGLISNNRDRPPDDLKLPSLVLASYFGTLPEATLAIARDDLADLQKSPDPQKLALVRRNLERAGLNDYAEAQFLQMLQRYQFPNLWNNAALLTDLLVRRPPVEDLGIPIVDDGFIGDERVHRLVRGDVEAADAARREAEDALFVDGQPQLDDRLRISGQTADDARQAMQVLQNAMRVRDRAWAELAYQLQWQADPLRRERASPSEQAKLTQLVADTKNLEGMLFADTPSAQIATITAATEAISNSLDESAAALAKECDDLRNEKTAISLRVLEAALANPFLPPELRKDVIGQYNRVAKQLIDDFNKPTAETTVVEEDVESNDTKDEDSPSIYEAIAVPSPEHPLLDMLANPPAEATASARWRLATDSLRSAIAEDNGNRSRKDWSDLERQLRWVAPVYYCGLSVTVSDAELPVARLRDVDLRDLVVWHAHRALQDFWGPAGDAQPYFARSANDYLDSARSLDRALFEDADAAADQDPADIATTAANIAAAIEAAKDWLPTRAASTVLLDPNEPVEINVGVNPRQNPVLPSQGTAAVFLRDNQRRMGDVQFPGASVSLPGRPATMEATIPNASPLIRSPLDAITMFRGHEFTDPFAIDPLEGVVVELDPHPFQPGAVTLRSPVKTLSIMLVLDCSQSMEQPLEAGQSRLAIAKEALAELLSWLGSEDDIRVGVRLFGHRVGWSTDRPVRVLASPTFAGEIPSDLTPDRDVERILPLGRLDFTAAQQVFGALGGVEHGWGQSPLYFALTESLRDDFAAEPAGADKHIIVITDGRNYQARPAAAERTSASQVAQASRAGRAPIHILALAPNAPDEPEAASQTAQLASQTGGTYQVLSTALDLRQSLHDFVQPDLYQLTDAAGRLVDEAELGVRLSDHAQQGPSQYSVRYESSREDLQLDGGEAIELYIRPDDPQLYAFAFDHEVAEMSELAVAGRPVDRWQRVHTPARRGAAAEFTISLQRSVGPPAAGDPALWRWTPRPQAVWIEITPLTSDRRPAGQSYLFYDANYEPDQPVPVLKLAAADWPALASAAAVSAWYRPAAVELSAQMPLDAARQAAPSGGQLRSHADFLAVPSNVFRIRVIERQAGTPDSAKWLMIAPPAAGGLRPSHIRRQFDQRHGIAVHTFDYADLNERQEQQLEAAGIGIATRDNALAGTWTARTVVVEVSEAGELLPLNAGRGESALPSPRSASIPLR